MRLLMGRLFALGLIVFLTILNSGTLRNFAAECYADGVRVIGVDLRIVSRARN